jgi:hypothetical protein
VSVKAVVFAVVVCAATVLLFSLVALLLVRLGESVVLTRSPEAHGSHPRPAELGDRWGQGDDDRPPPAADKRDTDAPDGPNQDSSQEDEGHHASDAERPIDDEGHAERKQTLGGPSE